MGMAVGMAFLLWSMNVFIKAVGLANSSCRGAAAVFGNVTILYPFGIEPGCYIDDSFAIGCNHTLGSSKPFLRSFDLEVLDISLEGTLQVNYPMSSWCPKTETGSTPFMNFASSPFVFSKLRNIFIAMGCGNLAYLLSRYGVIGGCMSVCYKDAIQSNGSSCNGIGCCKTTISSDLDLFTTRLRPIIRGFRASSKRTEDCKYASLVDQKWFEENLNNHFAEVQKMSHVPVVLNWEINAAL